MWPSWSMRILSGFMSLDVSAESHLRLLHESPPMNEAEIVDSFDGEDTFRHVELSHVLGERVVLDQPANQLQIPTS